MGGQMGMPLIQRQEIRTFSDPAIQKSVDAALASIPEDKRGAILEVDIPSAGGVKGVVAAKLNKHWSIGLVGEYTGEKKVSGGARVAFTW